MESPSVDSAAAAADGSGASEANCAGVEGSLRGHRVARAGVGDHDGPERGRRVRPDGTIGGTGGRTTVQRHHCDEHGAADQGGSASKSGPGAGPRRHHATKYLASGWWQMMASVVCSGSSWKPSLTVTPMRSPPSSSTTLALSVRSGQAG